jgi:hypothetical protein
MPKSKHRKNQKQKSRSRTQRIKGEQVHIQKKMEEEFLKGMETLRDRQLEIEEKKESDT